MRHALCAFLLCCPLLAQDTAPVPQTWSGGSGTFYVNGIVYQYVAGTDYTVVAAVHPVLNHKYLALKVRIINVGRQSVTIRPEEIAVEDVTAGRSLALVSGSDLGRKMRRPYNWARFTVNPVAGGPSGDEGTNQVLTPELMEMMRAMALRASASGNAPSFPNKNLLYTDTPGSLPVGGIPAPTAECGQVCQLLGRETSGPDVLAQLERQTSADSVEHSALLANTILPHTDTAGVLFYPMARLERDTSVSAHGKKAGILKVTVPVGAERFEFALRVE